jgi:DsbC/DsbD-like thiol-disulfide interchange protein
MSEVMNKLMTLAAAALLTPLPAFATADLPVRAELLHGWRDGDTHIAGLRVTLDPGWKTYWRAPGDSGIPPVMDWSRSGNLHAAEMLFPVPEVFDISGLRTIGYKDEVIFPLILTPADADAPISLSASLELGVCEDVCIPVSFTITGALGMGRAIDSRLQAAREDKPTAGDAPDCEITPISDGLRLALRMPLPMMSGTPETVIETADPSVWVSVPELTIEAGYIHAVAELVPPDAVPFALERDGLRVTILGGGEAIELRGCN